MKETHGMDKNDLRNGEVKGCLDLAQEYLEAAGSSLARGKYRVAVDTAYNAAELCAKGLFLIKLPEVPICQRLTTKFCELYKDQGALPDKLGRNLSMALELKTKARYDGHALIDERDAQVTIKLARDLMKTLKEQAPLD